jgi:hypothetical protein
VLGGVKGYAHTIVSATLDSACARAVLADSDGSWAWRVVCQNVGRADSLARGDRGCTSVALSLYRESPLETGDSDNLTASRRPHRDADSDRCCTCDPSRRTQERLDETEQVQAYNDGVSTNLNAFVSDERAVSDKAIKRANGLVAILDALGTKLLSFEDATRFVALRDSIQTLTQQVAETSLPGLDTKRLSTFTFNDTVVYVYEPQGGVTLGEVERFCHVLRIFELHSIVKGTPFRGALAIGDFFIGDQRTVLGPAISDAASWFEAADWIGIHATPHATMFIQSLLEQAPGSSIDHVIVDYEVPVKDSSLKRDKAPQKLKAINWPKAFFVAGLRPTGASKARGLLLSALSRCRVPKDTESKYFNAIRFFDAVEKLQELEDDFGATPSEGGPENDRRPVDSVDRNVALR